MSSHLFSISFVIHILSSAFLSAASAVGAEATFGDRTFRIPDGMELIVAADSSLVERPITADFDHEGFLYVSESSGSNDDVKTQLQQRPHRVLRLEDVNGDGRFDRRTVFADKLMFPEGTLWHDGSLYVAAPPSIWKLTDRDGDGVAEQREEWFQGKTLTGCANDLHGPYLGRDGWIYWCKGAFAEQTYDTPGRGQWTTRAAHIFRRHPRESWIEPVMTGGMDNPVDIVFTPGGERIFTTTFLQHPAGGRRDGLIHAIYGGVYGKQHGVINGHVRTGDLMPAMTHLGAAAPSGLALLESDQLGADYQGNVVAALFNMHKVTRHTLHHDGATFSTHDMDLVATDHLDFHPTDVLEDADGSLLIVDTGGWYKLCCPTSQLWKPDVLGAIYRLRRVDSSVRDARGLQLAWHDVPVDELVSRLDDPRPAVRRRAVTQLVPTPQQTVPAVTRMLANGHEDRPGGSATGRREAIWLLTRLGTPESLDALVAHAANETDETIRQAALHGVAIWRYHNGLPLVLNQLQSTNPQTRRVAAEAAGRLGVSNSIGHLADAARQPCDRTLLHSISYALIEINDSQRTRPLLADKTSAVRQAALIALDQMPSGNLAADEVLPMLNDDDTAVRQTALWVAQHHPDWSPQVAKYLTEWLASDTRHDDTAIALLSAYVGTAPVDDWIGTSLASGRLSGSRRRAVLEAMVNGFGKAIPRAWDVPLRSIVNDGSSPELIEDVAKVLRRAELEGPDAQRWRTTLLQAAQREALPMQTRLALLGALPAGSNVADPIVQLLLDNMGRDSEVALRTYAAGAAGRIVWTNDQLRSAALRAGTIGPLELDPFLSVFAPSSDPAIADVLLSQLAANSSLATLPADVLRQKLASFGDEVAEQAEQLIARYTPQDEAMRARIAELVQRMDQGDVRRGQEIFHGKQVACFACHAVGYLGGDIGPDLTHIGRTRSAADLLEAVLYPDVSFVRSYEPWTVETDDGRVINGVLREDDGRQVVLVNSARELVRLERTQVVSMEPSTTSIMPTGLDQQLTEQQLLDLVAFLLEAR